jgi:hypothetical protein
MSKSHANDRFETRAIHAGQEPDPQNGAVMTPVYFTSTYKQDAPAQPRQGYEYSRTSNPTRTALQDNLASLEGGRGAVLQLRPRGDERAARPARARRSRRRRQRPLRRHLPHLQARVRALRRALQLRRHDDVQRVESAIEERRATSTSRRRRIRCCASRTSPASRKSRTRKEAVVVDNTFATPYLQRRSSSARTSCCTR